MMKNRMNNIWHYTINHHWSKDILRSNFLYILLTILFNLCHFKLRPISFSIFFRLLILLNICQFFKAYIDHYRF